MPTNVRDASHPIDKRSHEHANVKYLSEPILTIPCSALLRPSFTFFPFLETMRVRSLRPCVRQTHTTLVEITDEAISFAEANGVMQSYRASRAPSRSQSLAILTAMESSTPPETPT